MPDWSNKKHVLAAVTRNGKNLTRASKILQGNKEVVLAAVTQNGYVLEYVLPELQRDIDVVLTAVTQNGYVLINAYPELRRDKKVVLAAVANDGDVLRYVAKELKGDREVVLAAVTQNGRALEYASRELQGDIEVVLTAVTVKDKDGYALEYASQELRADIEVVLAAVTRSGLSLRYVSPELKNEIKNYEGGASALLDHYEKNLEVNFTELSGDRYSLENLQGLDSIETIKERLNVVNPELGLDYDITYDGEEIHDIFEFRRIFFNEDDPVFMFRFH